MSTPHENGEHDWFSFSPHLQLLFVSYPGWLDPKYMIVFKFLAFENAYFRIVVTVLGISYIFPRLPIGYEISSLSSLLSNAPDFEL